MPENQSAKDSLQNLTHEVLRDVARNESCSKAWRKAAIKLLMYRNHKYQYLPDFRELKEEISEEQTAEREVKAVVEQAIEAPISSESERDGEEDDRTLFEIKDLVADKERRRIAGVDV